MTDEVLADMDYAAARRAMVNSQLRTSNVNQSHVISAMDRLPREHFVPANKAAHAYIDRAVKLHDDRVLNPAVTHGLMLEKAALRTDDNVLIIGASTGYLVNLVQPHVASVTAVEDQQTLFSVLEQNCANLSNVTLYKGELPGGYAKKAPYSLICIDGAVDHIPAGLVKQLAPDGRLVCGIADNGVTRLATGCKATHDTISLNAFADADITVLAAFTRAPEYNF